MKIVPQMVTVFADPTAGEVNVVLGGLRISLNSNEASYLADELVRSLERLRDMPQKPEVSAAGDVFNVSRHAGGPPAREAPQDIMAKPEWPPHTVVDAITRDKGLPPVREE
jgi:hypothetical protein